jgi:hypothetical protein
MFGTWIKGALFGDKALDRPVKRDFSSCAALAAARAREAQIKAKGKDKGKK